MIAIVLRVFAGCRCPRCPDATLVKAEVDGRKVLACRHCAGAFVGADLGLRLLAILRPDVPPPRHNMPSPACPVCRQGMRRVLTPDTEVETCKTHGVWFDAGDLPNVVRAVATALGRPVPEALGQLQRQTTAPPPPSDPAPQQPATAPSPPLPKRTLADDALDTADILMSAATTPLQVAAEVALFPFRATLATLELITEIVD